MKIKTLLIYLTISLALSSVLLLMGCERKQEANADEETIQNDTVQNDTVQINAVQIDASSAFFPMTVDLMTDLLDSDDPAEELVTMVATPDGFRNLSSGETDLLISSIPNEDQEAMLKESGCEYESIPIATEALVILVNKDNPVDSIEMQQLRHLYLADDQTWSDYGGNAATVISYQLTEGNGSQTVFSQYVDTDRITEFHQEITTMNAIIDAVADDPGGICYAFSSYVNKMYSNTNVKAVNIDGKSCGDPDYPLTCQVSAYYRKNSTNPELGKMVDLLRPDLS